MGCWSVYCGISKIAITAGSRCVLLPINKNKYQSWQYFTHNPATLPIFGTYNDYGGLENIEENSNTKLIEEYFGVSIQQFSDWFTEETTYNRGEVSKDVFKNFDEMKDWEFMFIKREVYDFLSSDAPEKGHLQFGNPKILELLGFIKSDEETGDTRFKNKWLFGDKELWSDDTWVQRPDKHSIFYFKSNWGNDLSGYIDIPEDKLWIEEKSMEQLWQYLDDKKVKEMFLPILTGRHYDGHNETMEALYKLLSEEQAKELMIKHNTPESIIDVYRNSIRDFGNEFCELTILSYNLSPMSSTFEPYIKFLTPQFGEFRRHQQILDKFAEINRSQIEEDDEMD